MVTGSGGALGMVSAWFWDGLGMIAGWVGPSKMSSWENVFFAIGTTSRYPVLGLGRIRAGSDRIWLGLVGSGRVWYDLAM